MMAPDLLAALTPVIEIFERLGVRYLIGGSVASSLCGVARSTLDVDLVVDLADRHVGPFAASLADAYYVEESAVREAVRRRDSFNVIHLDTMMKIDVFVLRRDEYEQEAIGRGQEHRLEEGGEGRRFLVGSPEDVILHKLAWFRSSGESSGRQWRDVLGVLAIQGESLDREYLVRWATYLNIGDLLDRAFEAAS